MTKPYEPDDPMALVGAGFPCPSREEADREMAEVFVEEYIRLGKSDEEIWRLFRNPTYRATHRVIHERGEEFVREILERVRAQFGYWSARDHSPAPGALDQGAWVRAGGGNHADRL